jgi:hypothetical protein
VRVAVGKVAVGKVVGKVAAGSLALEKRLGIEALGQDYSHQLLGGLDIQYCYMQGECSREEEGPMEEGPMEEGIA